jgi:hypothetical protein
MTATPYTDRLRNFFTQSLLGRTLAFLSLPLALLAIALWDDGEKQIPIFDVQLHYNQEAWPYVSPTAVINTLDELAVPHALVSSTPNEGTFKLLQQGSQRIIPMFSLYRKREDRETWFEDVDVLAHMERELRNWNYKGIGEFHLFGGQTETPVVRGLVKLATEYDMVLHAHSDPGAVESLFAMNPKVKILWAHAGMLTTPETVGRLLDRYPALWAELSHRLDVAPKGRLDPAWQALLLRHPDRFMIGTGTYSNEYWYQFRYILKQHRAWLNQLPPSVTEQIAYKNAARLFTAQP